jgi:hypothetical protein
VSVARIILALSLTACSTSNARDAGTDAAPDAEGGLVTDAACAAPASPGADAGSAGSCATPNEAGVECNPMTNLPCAAGQACDITSKHGFHCLAPPPPISAGLCAPCDVNVGSVCLPATTCVLTAAGHVCAPYCCTDADCVVPAHCDSTTLGLPTIGVCLR